MTLKNDEQENGAGFFQRWSNKKVEEQSKDSVHLEDENIANINLSEESASESEVQNAEIKTFKTDEDMPPIELLTEDSDYSGFLSPDVSDTLRNLALRKLFHLPLFNVVDGLDDYAEDFTKFAALGDIIPHEMQRMLDREKKKEEEKRELEKLEQEQQEHEQLSLNETEARAEQEASHQCVENDSIANIESDNNEKLPSSIIDVNDVELES
jgi:hypothetical protein